MISQSPAPEINFRLIYPRVMSPGVGRRTSIANHGNKQMSFPSGDSDDSEEEGFTTLVIPLGLELILQSLHL